ncbi:MAG: hypothetical protein C4308_01620 [Chitinophagaceae bacterium]
MKKLFFISIVVAFTACAVSNQFNPEARPISELQKKVPGVTVAELKEGMMVYKNNCSSCHALHAPSEFDQKKWEKELNEMMPRAKISDVSIQQKLRNYLYAMSK